MKRNEMINRSVQITFLMMLIALPAFTQETQGQKFRPAPPGARGVREYVWGVLFDQRMK